MLGVLVLAEMVLQVGKATELTRRAIQAAGYDTEESYALWHSTLLWWSYRAPSGFLLAAAFMYLMQHSVGAAHCFEFAFSIALIMACLSAMRLIPLRTKSFAEAGWESTISETTGN